MEWDVAALGFSEFATRDSLRQHRIGEGSTVAVTGVFVQFPGQRKFQPILRQGTLSMIPDEPMVTTTGKLGTVYLADVHVFGGNSGSPVLASPQDDMIHAGQRWFIGLVSGYYSETENSKMEIAVTVNAETQANSGVAMIVPADEVKKLIENNPILKSSRDAYLATLPKENPSAPHTP
jgi:phage tail protein X